MEKSNRKNTNSIAISVKNLGLSYDGETYIFKNINFSINSGEIISIIGKNGIGKTTLIKILSGIISFYNGEIFIQNQNLIKIKKRNLASKISYVPQNIDITYPIKAIEFIKTATYYKNHINEKKEMEKIYHIASIFGAKKLLSKRLDKLSGGEKQIIYIVRAFTQDTPIILMDEPISSLDIDNQNKIIWTIITLAKALNKTIIMALHNIDLAYNFSQKTLILINRDRYIYGDTKKVLSIDTLKNIYKDTDFFFYKDKKSFKRISYNLL